MHGRIADPPRKWTYTGRTCNMLKNKNGRLLVSWIMVPLVALIVLRDLLVSNTDYFLPMLILEIFSLGQLWIVYRHRKNRTTMEKLLICYAAWALLTRFLLRDFSTSVIPEVLIICEMCVAFYAMCSMESKKASCVFTLVTAILCAILTIGAMCAVFILLSDISEIRVLNNISIHIVTEKVITTSGDLGILQFVEFYPFNRNETAAWMMIGLWLLAYQWATCKQKLWRIPISYSMLLMYISVALQTSRTVNICVGFTIGLLAASALLKLHWKKIPAYILMAVTVILCTFVVYKSFSMVSNGLVKISAAIHETNTVTDMSPQETMDDDISEIADSVATTEELVLTDQRDFLSDLTTLTYRTKIWESEIDALVNHPLFLVFGQREADVANYLPAPHTHNGFLQVLAMYGVPGVILLGAFLVLLLKKMLRVYFGNYQISVKILTLPLFGLFIDSVMEPIFTAYIGLATICFMLIAGKLCREDTVSK